MTNQNNSPALPVGAPAMNDPCEANAIAAFSRAKPAVDVEYIAFDGELDGRTIYEVWYREEGEYCVSFEAYDQAAGYVYIDSIAVLLHQTASVRDALERRIELAREGRFRAWIAAAAFLVSLAALLAMMFTAGNSGQSGGVVAAVIGVVSSGALFFFGSWIPAGIFGRPRS